MDSLSITNIAINKLKPYIANPRKNDEVVDRMADSIKEFGFRIPVLAKSDGTVIDGHLRIKAAVKLGIKEIPVIVSDDMTEAQIKAFRIMVNKSVAWAEWDEELLRKELEALKVMDYNLEMTGFDMEEILKLVGSDVSETTPPELKDGDRSPFTQMTFTLHDSQAIEVQNALKKAIKAGCSDSEVNENSNGNALAFICQEYNRG